MLTETFVAATSTPDKISNTTVIGIHFHELQPLPALKSTFKKSSINPNCLAISPTHIFAAQADKAVIHVYNRERKNQECIIPFPERIRSIAITGEQNGGGFLIIGTEGGRLILWEVSKTTGSVSVVLIRTNSFAPEDRFPLHSITCMG